MHLGLESGAQFNELGPVAHQLPQLTRRRRCDPGFGKSADAEQIDEIIGVPLVVLHSSLAPVQPRRRCEVDVGAEGLQQIDRPIPAIGRLDDHFRFLAGLCDDRGEIRRAVGDARLGQCVAVTVLADDDRAAAMEVDTDVLSIHRGLLFVRCCC